MQIRLNMLLLGISGFIAYFVECVSADKILFIGPLLSNECSEWILSHSLQIIIVTLLVNVIVFVASQCRIVSRQEKQVYENICAKVFLEVISDNEELDDSLWKVSILRACRRKSERPYLKAVGRFQKKAPKKRARVTFAPGEGCAGLAYQTNHLIRLEIDAGDELKPHKYLDDCEKTLKLPRRKAKRLNDKCAGYLCVPLLFFNEHHPWGVLSIDCAEKGSIHKLDARALETLVAHFSTFFRDERSK